METLWLKKVSIVLRPINYTSLEVKDRIINGADDLFLRYGIKSITMDDIASHLSISKKTIYQHFKDKDELVIEVTSVHMQKEQDDIDAITAASSNAIDELMGISKYIRKNMEKMNQSVIFDLQKYHPKAFLKFTEHKDCCIRDTVVVNMIKGKEQGYFRADINENILAKLRMEQVQMAFDMQIFPPTEYNLADVQMEFFLHFVMGIVTPKGLELLERYKTEDNQI